MPGCRGQRTLRFCVDGRTLDRTCAQDERCMNNACVYVFQDAGAGTCAPGCSGSTTVRRCISGEAVDVACQPGRTCESGDCVAHTTNPDAGTTTCVNTCMDETTLSACTATGETLVVTCAANAPCRDGACTPPPDPAPEVESDCACTSVPVGARGTWLAGMVTLLAARVGRRRKVHGRP